MNRIPRFGVTLLLAGSLAPGAQAAINPGTARIGIGPAAGSYSFIGALDAGSIDPKQMSGVKQDCQPSGLALSCQVVVDVKATDLPVKGSLTEPARGLNGSFNASCSLKGRLTVDATVSAGAVSIGSLGGGFGAQRCSWNASFGSAGGLSGTLGASAISLQAFGGASPAADLGAHVLAQVLGGSGIFAGARGGGSLDQSIRMPLSPDMLRGSLDQVLRSVLGGVIRVPIDFPTATPAPPAAGSQLDLTLAAGPPAVQIASPSGRSARTSDRLEVLAPPGATCVATGQRLTAWGRPRGGRVDLGSATQGPTTGSVRFPRLFRALRGSWLIEVGCRSRVNRYTLSGRFVRSEPYASSTSRRFTVRQY